MTVQTDNTVARCNAMNEQMDRSNAEMVEEDVKMSSNGDM
jgi:hypothetical protein